MGYTRVVGIDPGKSGGIASLISIDGRLHKMTAWKMPETEFDTVELLQQFNDNRPTIVYMELVGGMPGMGLHQTWRFAQHYGMLRGILAGINFRREFVRPQQWMKTLQCLTGGDKNVSKRKAQEIFPHVKVTHAIADALLIAEYGRRRELGLKR